MQESDKPFHFSRQTLLRKLIPNKDFPGFLINLGNRYEFEASQSRELRETEESPPRIASIPAVPFSRTKPARARQAHTRHPQPRVMSSTTTTQPSGGTATPTTTISSTQAPPATTALVTTTTGTPTSSGTSQNLYQGWLSLSTLSAQGTQANVPTTQSASGGPLSAPPSGQGIPASTIVTQAGTFTAPTFTTPPTVIGGQTSTGPTVTTTYTAIWTPRIVPTNVWLSAQSALITTTAPSSIPGFAQTAGVQHQTANPHLLFTPPSLPHHSSTGAGQHTVATGVPMGQPQVTAPFYVPTQVPSSGQAIPAVGSHSGTYHAPGYSTPFSVNPQMSNLMANLAGMSLANKEVLENMRIIDPPADVVFSGEAHENVAEFLFNYEEWARSRKLSETEKMDILPRALRGEARHWYRTLPQPMEWGEFTSRIKRHHRIEDAALMARNALNNRFQQPGESVKTFIGHYARVSQRLSPPIPEDELAKMIRRNLRVEFKAILLSCGPLSLTDLHDKCLQAEQTLGLNRSVEAWTQNYLGAQQLNPPPAQVWRQPEPMFQYGTPSPYHGHQALPGPITPTRPFPFNMSDPSTNPTGTRPQYGQPLAATMNQPVTHAPRLSLPAIQGRGPLQQSASIPLSNSAAPMVHQSTTYHSQGHGQVPVSANWASFHSFPLPSESDPYPAPIIPPIVQAVLQPQGYSSQVQPVQGYSWQYVPQGYNGRSATSSGSEEAGRRGNRRRNNGQSNRNQSGNNARRTPANAPLAPRQNYTPEQKCYNCQGLGHFSNVCPSARVQNTRQQGNGVAGSLKPGANLPATTQ